MEAESGAETSNPGPGILVRSRCPDRAPEGTLGGAVVSL